MNGRSGMKPSEDLKKELEMMELLDKVAKENAELDRKRAEAAAAAAEGTPPEPDAAAGEAKPEPLNPEP